MEEMPMILPPRFCAIIWRAAAWVVWKVPVMLVVMWEVRVGSSRLGVLVRIDGNLLEISQVEHMV